MKTATSGSWTSRAGQYGRLLRRPGPGLRVLILPGLACPAAQYTGPAMEWLPPGWDVEIWEAPGAGSTPFRGDDQATVDGLVKAFDAAALGEDGGRAMFLIGHSLGGLVALLLAERRPEGVAGFVNVEGNLGPADCVFTAAAADQDMAGFATEWLPRAVEQLRSAGRPGERAYAEILSSLPSPRAYHAHSRSIVAHSARPDLVGRYQRLECRTLYVHGSASGDPATLARLRSSGKVATIPDAGHFPHLDQPGVFYPLVTRWIGS